MHQVCATDQARPCLPDAPSQWQPCPVASVLVSCRVSCPLSCSTADVLVERGQREGCRRVLYIDCSRSRSIIDFLCHTAKPTPRVFCVTVRIRHSACLCAAQRHVPARRCYYSKYYCEVGRLVDTSHYELLRTIVILNILDPIGRNKLAELRSEFHRLQPSNHMLAPTLLASTCQRIVSHHHQIIG